jgi:crotonobetainyl-CoA:carnitine CoA-transferase CaiB-like acyl-CoA transferase
VLTALNAAVAINAALYRRQATGKGEHVVVSLLDSALSGLVNVVQSALVSGNEAKRYGNAHASVVPYETLPVADGWITVAAGNDAQYRRLCAVLGRDDLAEDPRFATNSDRVRNRDALIPELTAELSARPGEEWVEELNAAGVPVGKIRGVLEAVRAAADAGRSATFTVEHPTAGPLAQVRPGFADSDGGGMWTTTPPPRLGEHTREILADLGVAADRIAELEKRGVVRQAPDA